MKGNPGALTLLNEVAERANELLRAMEINEENPGIGSARLLEEKRGALENAIDRLNGVA